MTKVSHQREWAIRNPEKRRANYNKWAKTEYGRKVDSEKHKRYRRENPEHYREYYRQRRIKRLLNAE